MAGYKDKEWLKNAYYEEERSLSDIADEFDVTIESVRYYMEKFDFPRRRRGAREGEKNPAWKGGPKMVVCENCGEEFETTRWKAENDLATYCSKDCKHEHFQERYAGEGNHQYGVRGEANSTYGRTGEDHPMHGVTGPENPNWAGGGQWRDDSRWFKARADVLDRDDGECQECGLTNAEHVEQYGYEIHVHHIEPVSDGGEKFDTENLVTLCADCHSQKHDNGFPNQNRAE